MSFLKNMFFGKEEAKRSAVTNTNTNMNYNPPMMQQMPTKANRRGNPTGRTDYGSFAVNPTMPDDDMITVKEVQPSQATPGQTPESSVNVSLRFGQDRLCVKQTAQEIPCTVSIQAYGADIAQIEANRPGLDLVCVIDTSGSMRGDKIELVKRTMKFVLTKMTQWDRLCVIVFSNSAYKLCRLIQCTESGKLELTGIIDQIGAGGGTEIMQGMETAINVLGHRRVVNTVSSVLLLSDGQDNQGHTAISRAQQLFARTANVVQRGYTVHAFGYGRDHDANLMNMISEQKEGEFHFVEDDASIPECFSDCLGGLVSLVADDIHVQLNVAAQQLVPCSISRVFNEGSTQIFRMPQLTSGDNKDTVFLLHVPPYNGVIEQEIEITPVTASISYKLVATGEQKTTQVNLTFAVDEEVDTMIVEDVYVHYARVRTAEVLSLAESFGDRNDLASARKTLTDGAAEMRGTPVAGNPIVQQLIRDMEGAIARFQDVQTWNHGGKAMLKNMSRGHREQKASKAMPMYRNMCQMAYNASANDYFNSS